MRYDRKSIQKGMFIALDSGLPATVKYGAQPPRYGEPPKPKPPSFAKIGEQLDDAKRRLEEIAKAVRDARSR